MSRSAIVVCALLVSLARAAEPTDNNCRFEGTWSATGTRQTLPVENDAHAALLHVAGAVTLTGGAGLPRGFQGDAIGFFDGRETTVGRAVWTDEHGDRIYSELKGGPAQNGGRVNGTFTGGTGRYAGITGGFTLTWQYLVVTEDGTVQGRTTTLTGNYRCPETPR